MNIKEIQEKVVKVSDNYVKLCGINRDNERYILKLQEEVGELTQSYLSLTKRGRNRGKSDAEIKEDFANEISDVMGQILLIANHFDIDVENAIENKWFKYLKE